MPKMDGKVALVTGGSSGIGRATALLFAREGARVVVAARGAERGKAVAQQIREAGGSAAFVQTDVAKAADVERMVAQAVRQFGRLDYAVNNAAADLGAFALTADLSETEYDETMAVDLKGVWLGMKYEIKQMLAQEPAGGAIVNTSSVNGLGGVPMASIYAAAKAGILGLTKSAAMEYGVKGVRINSLVAGAFDTPMLRKAMKHASGGDAAKLEKIEASYKAIIANRRIGDPSEAAEAIVWLCSDAASYVTGHSMIVDGGLTASFR